MIPKSMPSGHAPMGGNRFSEKIMPQQKISDESDSAKLDQTLARAWRRGLRGGIFSENAGSIPMRVLGAAAVIALLTGPAYAQMMPNVNLIPEIASKTPEEKEQEATQQKAYRESLKKIPDAKVSSDPWGNVRSVDTPKTSAPAKPRTKTGSTIN
jgi:hypothetical protein